jgi:hypothetical protein
MIARIGNLTAAPQSLRPIKSLEFLREEKTRFPFDFLRHCFRGNGVFSLCITGAGERNFVFAARADYAAARWRGVVKAVSRPVASGARTLD